MDPIIVNGKVVDTLQYYGSAEENAEQINKDLVPFFVTLLQRVEAAANAYEREEAKEAFKDWANTTDNIATINTKQTSSNSSWKRQASQEGNYTVQRGDTLYTLARKFNTTVDRLAMMNNIDDDNRGNIYVGERLWVPVIPMVEFSTPGVSNSVAAPLSTFNYSQQRNQWGNMVGFVSDFANTLGFASTGAGLYYRNSSAMSLYNNNQFSFTDERGVQSARSLNFRSGWHATSASVQAQKAGFLNQVQWANRVKTFGVAAGRISFVTGAAVSGYEFADAVLEGNYLQAGKSGLDIGALSIMTFCGPAGFVIGGAYFMISAPRPNIIPTNVNVGLTPNITIVPDNLFVAPRIIPQR